MRRFRAAPTLALPIFSFSAGCRVSHAARAERKDHNTLLNALGARQGLANIRRSMLNAMVEYNIAIVDLEGARGTLLQYNNVVIPEP